jgi:nitroimidazol reductase NimA-like FMN-containing flavoprotein (pyridoxamine 5'-phosphate oxidase superfamily)/GNAT superfamily N-acetyltransferase
MRRKIYRMDSTAALALLERAPYVQVATTTAAGHPVLRTVHGVLVDGAIAYHGAPAGEKAEAVGRPAVVNAEEVIAQIPSYFIDPERACPATTYFESVQIEGTLEEVTDPDAKARVLEALMRKYQPEGGYSPIRADDPRYRGAVRGILIVRVPLTHVSGKSKLGQNRPPELLAGVALALWQRGAPGDARALMRVLSANPAVPTPPFLHGPAGTRLDCAPSGRALDDVVALLRGQYWLEGVTDAVIRGSHATAPAWVAAHDREGRLVASARAMTDGRVAWICDVIVAPDARGRGLGRAVCELLLDHPAVRGVRQLRLATRDATGLYERLGFRAYDSRYPMMQLTRS